MEVHVYNMRKCIRKVILALLLSLFVCLLHYVHNLKTIERTQFIFTHKMEIYILLESSDRGATSGSRIYFGIFDDICIITHKTINGFRVLFFVQDGAYLGTHI